MIAFVIFWSSIFSILFFLLGIFFNALAAAFNALATSLVDILKKLVWVALAELVLFLLYALADQVVISGFLASMGMLVSGVVMTIFLVVVIVVLYLTWGLPITIIAGATIGGCASFVAVILVCISGFLEWLAGLCEKIYGKFLGIVISSVEKC